MPSITISSAGTSNAIQLDWVGAQTTSLSVSFGSSTSSAATQVQGTFDDPMRNTSPTWFLLSTTTFTSSTHFDTPTLLQILSPIAGVRLNSTGLSSSNITLRWLQNAGA